MDPQGSTPDITMGGAPSHSPQSSADIPAVTPAPSTPQNGDLLGRLEHSHQTGAPVTDTPSQSTPENPTPSVEPENPGQQQPKKEDSVVPNQQTPVDPDLAKWASSQNITLNTPEAITLAKRLRDTQTALHNAKNEKVRTIQNGDDEEDPYVDPSVQQVNEVNRRLDRFEFFERNPEAKAFEQKMIDFVVDLDENGDKQAAWFYANNWGHLYNVVKSQEVSSDPATLVDQGRQQERENLAKAQQAAPPSSAAYASAPQATPSDDEKIANMSQAEYNEWRKTNNPFSR